MRFLVFHLILALTVTHAHAKDLGHGRPGDLFVVHHAPDPVNTRTGNFFLPLQDYYLSCFQFPLEVYRSYNSFSTKNGPFGKGWTFNYDIQIIVGQQGGIKVVEADGYVNEYVPVENEFQSQKEIIEAIIEARKKEDAQYAPNKKPKSDATYKEMKEKLYNDPSYYQSLKDRYVQQPALSPSGKYVSTNRGTSYLTNKDKGFVRESENGQKETYNEKGLLIKIEDLNGNTLRFSYDGASRLSRVYDDCANHIEMNYNRQGKISSIKDSFQRTLSYSYDKDGRLVSFTGLDKKPMDYAYDDFNRMTKITFADGTTTDIIYTKNGRVAAQKGPGKKHTVFTYGSEKNQTWTQVEDKLMKRKDTYRYFDSENKIIHEAPETTTTTVLSACCGKPISIKTTDGINDTFEYDENGNLKSRTDAAGNKTLFDYEPRYEAISDITEEQTGKKLRYRYDRKGNLIFAQSTLGTQKEFLKIAYEKHGKIRHIEDHLGNEIFFDYSSMGMEERILKKRNGKVTAQITFAYDRMGNRLETTFTPNTDNTREEIRVTLLSFMRLLEPTGIDFEL